MIFPLRRNFNFDTALRYYPVVQIIEKLNNPKLALLEVGSGTNGISDYYAGKVIGVDTDFAKTQGEKNPNIEYHKGSINKLPFKNNSFDVVICMDTLEHLPSEQREKAISEILRVTKTAGLAIIGFPSGGISSFAEQVINSLYKGKYGQEHLWLKEHRINGLPTDEEIKTILKNLGIAENQIKIIKNANILIWLKIHILYTVFSASLLSRALKYFYKIFHFKSRLPIPPFYRSIFVIKK